MPKLNRASFLAVALLPLPLAAHHSFVAFDQEKEAFVRGTVTEYQFRNPHTYIFVDVPMEGGESARWRIEGETRNDLYRNGWRDDSLQPGDVVSVRVQPARDPARRYARLLDLEKTDGTVLAIPNAEDEQGRVVTAPAESLEGVWLPVQSFFVFGAKVAPLANEKARAELAQQTGVPRRARCIDMGDSPATRARPRLRDRNRLRRPDPHPRRGRCRAADDPHGRPPSPPSRSPTMKRPGPAIPSATGKAGRW